MLIKCSDFPALMELLFDMKSIFNPVFELVKLLVAPICIGFLLLRIQRNAYRTKFTSRFDAAYTQLFRMTKREPIHYEYRIVPNYFDKVRDALEEYKPDHIKNTDELYMIANALRGYQTNHKEKKEFKEEAVIILDKLKKIAKGYRINIKKLEKKAIRK